MPPWVRLAAVTTMPSILANCLWSKTVNHYCDSSYGAIVWANKNGYETFRQLASLAGHPSLSPFAVTRDPPKQRADCDVDRHLEDWKRYLECDVMARVFLQDRYFVTSFLCSLHPSIQHFFSSHLEPLVYAVPSNRPLPDAYNPHGITPYLLQYATQREAANYITESPRSLRSGSQHQVVQSIQAGFALSDQIVFATFAISLVTFLMIFLCSVSRSLVILVTANATSSRSLWVATLAMPVIAVLITHPELSPSMPWRTCQ